MNTHKFLNISIGVLVVVIALIWIVPMSDSRSMHGGMPEDTSGENPVVYEGPSN
ncbi:MAG TPA: hypothetical protein VJJ22_02230 [Candidatus Paceibacterota bacterium]